LTRFPLFVGLITDQPTRAAALLADVALLRSHPSLSDLVAIVLPNGACATELDAVLLHSRKLGLGTIVISEERQRADARSGAFGVWRDRPPGRLEISRARTMLQRYLGQLQHETPGSIVWVLDDDMRLDSRAWRYLPWLPKFRTAGVDILIGALEDGSPNPPLCGMWVQLWDLYQNLLWLRSLDSDSLLPDRSEENRDLRRRYPDYYYDLSRKHSGHLEAVYWVEPAEPGETVGQTVHRVASGAIGILNGIPLTRPVRVDQVREPLLEARDSVNRGGSTFVLNPRALRETPNTMVRVNGQDARRSDMIWAVINRYHHGLVCKQVAFPVMHRSSSAGGPVLDTAKVVQELVGSAVYAALVAFLEPRPGHGVRFSEHSASEVCAGVLSSLGIRLRTLEERYSCAQRLIPELEGVLPVPVPAEFVECLNVWFADSTLERIRTGVRGVTASDLLAFLMGLQTTVDAYAASRVEVSDLRGECALLLGH
jgi:hypothetical protein